MNIERVKIASLVGDPSNVRKHDQKNLDAIKGSLARFGQQKPIVVGANNVVIAGNGTVAAALSLGWVEISIVRSELIGPEATAFAIADNRTAELAEWDEDALAQQLAALAIDDEDLARATGFDARELDRLSLGQDLEQDAVPETPIEPITRRGDVWILGEHRVMCGDSTDDADLARLFGESRADICFTSPPYALGTSITLRGNRSMMSQRGSAYIGHADRPQEWLDLMSRWFDASRPYISDVWVVNVQPLAGNKRDLFRWIYDRVGQLIDVVTWDKQVSVPHIQAGVLSARFEWLIAFGKENASRCFPLSSWRGTISSVYVGLLQRGNEFSDIHAATMPLHLPAWVLGTLCDRSQVVYDPFGGTGTTLIAAHQLRKRSFLMEIEPVYVDVIVKRWETISGEVARREVV